MYNLKLLHLKLHTDAGTHTHIYELFEKAKIMHNFLKSTFGKISVHNDSTNTVLLLILFFPIVEEWKVTKLRNVMMGDYWP